MIKAQQLHKLKQFKNYGKIIRHLSKISYWLENNIQELYKFDPNKTTYQNLYDRNKFKDGLIDKMQDMITRKYRQLNVKDWNKLY